MEDSKQPKKRISSMGGNLLLKDRQNLSQLLKKRRIYGSDDVFGFKYIVDEILNI